MPCHLLPSLPARRQRARGRGGTAGFCSQPGEAEQHFGYAFIGVLHGGLEVVPRSSISRRVPPGDELGHALLRAGTTGCSRVAEDLSSMQLANGVFTCCLYLNKKIKSDL